MAHWKLQHRRLVHRIRRELFRGLDAKLTGILEMSMQRQAAEYRGLLRAGAPLPSLAETEFQVFSQNGEDGIIHFLLSLVGDGGRRFLEIGCGDGWECNTAALAKHRGWDGWLVEGDPHLADLARQHFDLEPGVRQRDVRVLASRVTRENVGALLADQGITAVDLLSLDIDGCDWWVWQALSRIRPRVAVVEYNAYFGPEAAVTIPYSPDFRRAAAHPSGLCFGASLAAMVRLGRDKGYDLVGCDSAGTNAFFVREDLRPPALPSLTAAEAYRPSPVLSGIARRQGDPDVAEMGLATV